MADTRQPEERSETGTKPGPRRQCAGCAKRDSADDLLRIVLGEQGELAVDLADSRFGRGSHVHASKECMQKALRGGFAKVFKTGSVRVEGTVESIGEQIVIAADRRIEGLLAGARRGKLAVAGADTVREVCREGNAALVVVACDAAAATKHPEIQEAVAEGKATAWGNKQRLGAIFGRDETAVCAVLHEGVAKAIKSARQQALSFAGGAVARSEAWWSSEDR
jgi:predicted RNA-binding protein YlxR (DUF448 family)/ribosomal protein L7Ae-like RNA K-turn-binding protein